MSCGQTRRRRRRKTSWISIASTARGVGVGGTKPLGSWSACSQGTPPRLVPLRARSGRRRWMPEPLTGDRLAHDRVVSCQRHPHRVGVVLPPARRALDVGEEKRHRARRLHAHGRERLTAPVRSLGHGEALTSKGAEQCAAGDCARERSLLRHFVRLHRAWCREFCRGCPYWAGRSSLADQPSEKPHRCRPFTHAIGL